MKFRLLALSIALFFAQSTYAQDSNEEQIELTEEETILYLDSLDAMMNYEYGEIDIDGGLAKLKVPENYKYLNPEQSAFVLTDIWGNPPSENLGMLLLKKESPIAIGDFSYAVEITYSEEGYIEDEDAKELDYDDLLDEMKEDTKNASTERQKQGYESIELVRWASQPFYDEVNKKLHWAKELKFGEAEKNTLNYEIRILGRKGYLNLNVIGDIDQLSKVKKHADKILKSINFEEGNRYSDFDPGIDKIAALGIGGLIAGKVLAKAGFFVLILKFWKFIAIGAVALFAGLRKYFGGKNKD
tara:strand:+ start:530 stop:1429 length:900 start_codon:yes stop_codon:yes gene_type:complete